MFAWHRQERVAGTEPKQRHAAVIARASEQPTAAIETAVQNQIFFEASHRKLAQDLAAPQIPNDHVSVVPRAEQDARLCRVHADDPDVLRFVVAVQTVFQPAFGGVPDLDHVFAAGNGEQRAVARQGDLVGLDGRPRGAREGGLEDSFEREDEEVDEVGRAV